MLIQPDDTMELRFAEEQKIHLADFAVATDVLGPGRRAIIWVQGCPRRCSGCITPHMQRFDVERTWIALAQLTQRILAELPLEGITFVGGEPFSHAGQLAMLVHEIRRSTDLSVVTYTGHTLERIRETKRSEWQELLAVTDLLIDGEYHEEEHCDLLWRGSTNQRLHVLTPRYAQLADQVKDTRGRWLELSLSEQGQLRVIGIPERGFFERLREQLAGHDLDFALDTPQ